MNDPLPKPLLAVRLAGTQDEMGAQHGKLVADDALRLFDFYRTMPVRALGGDMRGVGGAIGRAAIRTLATTWQARLVRDRPAELAGRARAFIESVLEARGLSRERKLARDAMLAMATMDSLQNCVSLIARGRLGPFAAQTLPRAIVAAAPACSTLIAWGEATTDGELLFARNFDFPGVGVWDAAPAFVACAPRGTPGQRYAFFTTRGADAPVVTVVNEAGLVFAPHTRWHRGVTFGGAMIVDVIHELARRAESLADAIAIARELRASSSWGVAIGSAREKSAVVLELAGGALELIKPAPRASYLTCTNRYRSEAMMQHQLAGSSAWAFHSDRREKRLRGFADERSAPFDAATLARALGDRHDVCAPAHRRHFGGVLAQATNVHAVVVEPAQRRALVGVDRAPCCEGAFAELAWQWDGPVGAWSIHDAGAHAAGFTMHARADVAAPHDAATAHVRAAVRAYEAGHNTAAARASIERAVAVDPEDPSLRLAAAWLALEDGAPRDAVAHVQTGLALEDEPYRRGQLLTWGARAARDHDATRARAWEAELAALHGPEFDELRAVSRRSGRPHVNLLMTDAY